MKAKGNGLEFARGRRCSVGDTVVRRCDDVVRVKLGQRRSTRAQLHEGTPLLMQQAPFYMFAAAVHEEPVPWVPPCRPREAVLSQLRML
jgi:hypothetical protein